jgi:hypothetical protein
MAPGLGNYDDIFGFIFRFAFPADPVAYAAWEALSPFNALRVDFATTPPAPALFPFPTLKPRTSSTAETALQADFDLFVNATIRRLSGRFDVSVIPYSASVLAVSYDFGLGCYYNGVLCLGDNRDSAYLAITPSIAFPVFASTGDYADDYLVMGADHHYNGLGVYSNVNIYNYVRQVGFDQVADSQYLGSANTLVPDYSSSAGATYAGTQNAPQFFQWRYSLDCAALDPICANVATSGFPSVTPGSTTLWIDRAYQASASLAGPLYTSLIQPLVLYSVDRCRPQPCDADGSCGSLRTNVLQDIALYSLRVSQSSTASPLFGVTFNATNAVDGNGLHSLASTSAETSPYWEIDLGFSRNVSSINVAGLLLHYALVLVSNTPFSSPDLATAVSEAEQVLSQPNLLVLDEAGNVNRVFRYLRIQIDPALTQFYVGFGAQRELVQPKYELALFEVNIYAYCLNAAN